MSCCPPRMSITAYFPQCPSVAVYFEARRNYLLTNQAMLNARGGINDLSSEYWRPEARAAANVKEHEAKPATRTARLIARGPGPSIQLMLKIRFVTLYTNNGWYETLHVTILIYSYISNFSYNPRLPILKTSYWSNTLFGHRDLVPCDVTINLRRSLSHVHQQWRTYMCEICGKQS